MTSDPDPEFLTAPEDLLHSKPNKSGMDLVRVMTD